MSNDQRNLDKEIISERNQINKESSPNILMSNNDLLQTEENTDHKNEQKNNNEEKKAHSSYNIDALEL